MGRKINRKNNKRLPLFIGIFILCILGVLNINRIEYFIKQSIKDIINIEDSINENTNEEKLKEEIKSIEVVATGDFLIHKEILETQYNLQNDSYDFTNNLKYIKKYLYNADIAIANLETTLAGKENYDYSGYPSFNTPDSLADAMKEVGIDVVANMNNHALDRDVRGYKRTREVLVEKGFDVIGSRASTEDKRYIIKDVKGIKLGIISYGYTMTAGSGGRGLNGTEISSDLLPLMNTFHPNDINQDLQSMSEQIDNMRNDGAEAIIFYMHWGDEYELEPNSMQKEMAQFLANKKVDIIFGTHPHSLQPIDILKSSDGTSNTAVIYSMGNFLSSQRTERIGNPYTEDGVIVSINISKNMNTNKIDVDTPKYIPTWVNWYEKEGKLFYEVVPATIYDADYLTENGKVRVKESFERTKSIIEKFNSNIKVKYD
ncbi:hypothetical protein JCM1393_10780 [Clostridium carnis]